MNKVKCINGHYFDLDRFGCCPTCGEGVGVQAEERKSKNAVSSIRKSKLEVIDKTEILNEEKNENVIPATGKVAGIKWKFWQKEQEAVEQIDVKKNEESQLELQESTVVQEAKKEETLPKEDTSINQNEGMQKKYEPTLNIDKPNSPSDDQTVDNSLAQAVAATGHGMFSALPNTVAFYDFTEAEPPVGWLICIKGNYQGQAFVCKTGKNRIGRNPNCDINMGNEVSITREPHAIIIYEPKQKVFYLQNGTGDGLVYLNDELLFSHEQLHAYDKIQIGNAEFVFLPLCGENFTWDDYIN